MAADEKQVSALIRRHEQIKRWEGSDTNLEPVTPKKNKIKVKFQDGCVFLAACSSGDKGEVEKLLQRGADINTANVDGLTALHQACIDDNLEMVEFLVENGADVDVCDNEGWTPLHATASCAFTEIARYLINHNANVATVNNDGDLPIDIAENEEMENLLQEEMNKQGIDAEAARCEEEQRMLEDANQWLRDKTVKEIQHPKTGATALHVAAAKGYTKVMNVLLEAGVDINAEDYDGWTPLHAAAHWGQEEACKILVENMCDMMHKNKAGHTAFDLAEKDMLKLLEELKEKQASARSKHEIDTEIILPSGHAGKRRSSVTRMSGDQKQNVIQRTSEEERAALAALHPVKTDDKILNRISITTDDGDNETERQNEKNKQVSQHPQLPASTSVSTPITTTSWWQPNTAPASSPGGELRRPDMPKIEEVSETDRPAPTPVIPTTVTTPPVPSVSTTLPSSVQPASSTDTTAVLSTRPSVSISKVDKNSDLDNDTSVQDSAARKPASSLSSGRDFVSRSISVPARLPTQKLQEQISRGRLASAGSTTTPVAATTPATSLSTADTDGKPGDRSYEPPKRDEETETQRKARAKHARQTRRSTQGVSLEDIEKAEESLKSDKDVTDTSAVSSHLPTSRNSHLTKESLPAGGGEVTEVPTTGKTTAIGSISSAGGSDADIREDKTITSGYRHRISDDKSDSSDVPSTRSYRRAREDKDLNPSTGVTSTYIPRSQRNSALQQTDTGSSSQSLLRSASLRTGRQAEQTTPQAEEEPKKDETNAQEKKEEKKELSSIRARRQRRERRSTGIVLDSEDGEVSKENKAEEEKKDDDGKAVKDRKADEDKKDYNLGSSRYGRYNSNSDFSSQRPVSYSEVSKSTGSLDVDYKKKYEDERSENDRLRKELEETKKSLLEAKAELDKVMKQKDASRNIDRDKRALERKLSEMEEELKLMGKLKTENKKLKEENKALSRLVANLSR